MKHPAGVKAGRHWPFSYLSLTTVIVPPLAPRTLTENTFQRSHLCFLKLWCFGKTKTLKVFSCTNCVFCVWFYQQQLLYKHMDTITDGWIKKELDHKYQKNCAFMPLYVCNDAIKPQRNVFLLFNEAHLNNKGVKLQVPSHANQKWNGWRTAKYRTVCL